MMMDSMIFRLIRGFEHRKEAENGLFVVVVFFYHFFGFLHHFVECFHISAVVVVVVDMIY